MYRRQLLTLPGMTELIHIWELSPLCSHQRKLMEIAADIHYYSGVFSSFYPFYKVVTVQIYVLCRQMAFNYKRHYVTNLCT